MVISSRVTFEIDSYNRLRALLFDSLQHMDINCLE